MNYSIKTRIETEGKFKIMPGPQNSYEYHQPRYLLVTNQITSLVNAYSHALQHPSWLASVVIERSTLAVKWIVQRPHDLRRHLRIGFPLFTFNYTIKNTYLTIPVACQHEATVEKKDPLQRAVTFSSSRRKKSRQAMF